MIRPIPRVLPAALIALTLTLAGCAVEGPAGDGAYAPRSEPAARMALRPEYKVFYDALIDYGDWDLIEPYGYVFRPRVDPLLWRPYSYGYWAPTDNFGWVWNSSDVFGWATDHYGRWFYDEYKGWVWVPGVQWAPAWVSWQMNDSYAGWAPLAPNGVDMYGQPIPGGPYLYAPLTQLTNTTVRASAVTADHLISTERQTMKPVTAVTEHDGVTLPAGPPLARVERATGFSLPRARLDDAVAVGAPQDALRRGGEGSTGAAPDGAAGGSNAGTRIEAIRRAALEASRETQSLTANPAATPAHIAVVRPFGVPGIKPGSAAPTAPRPAKPSAPPDSTKH